MLNVVVDNESIEVVDSFCYLGDMITSGGGCNEATVVCCRTVWKKFKELLPLLTSESISLRNCGKVFVTYVRSALLHASECWVLKKEELLRLNTHNDLISGSTKSKPSTLLVMLDKEDHQKLGKTSS